MIEKFWGVCRLSVYPKSVFIKSLNTSPHVYVGMIFRKKLPNFWIFQPSVRLWDPQRCFSFYSKIAVRKFTRCNISYVTGCFQLRGVSFLVRKRLSRRCLTCSRPLFSPDFGSKRIHYFLHIT